jgi:hypothetical protein
MTNEQEYVLDVIVKCIKIPYNVKNKISGEDIKDKRLRNLINLFYLSYWENLSLNENNTLDNIIKELNWDFDIISFLKQKIA